jgi:hypothetical protein
MNELLSIQEQYALRILAAESTFGSQEGDPMVALDEHKRVIRGIVSDLIAEVIVSIGKSQRQGICDTANKEDYFIKDKGSIVTLTKDLIEAVKKRR